jgi:4-hydroxy-tetrahydrodipicolinate reductase
MKRIAIAGASGRMGRMLIETVLDEANKTASQLADKDAGLTLSGALTREGAAGLGRDAGAFLGVDTGVLMSTDVDAVLAQSDYLIDFTRPEASLDLLDAAVRAKVGVVIGTTGFSVEQKQRIETASQSIPIVFAPNMSVGVNVTLKLLDMAARLMSTGYDIEVLEAHHRHKVDAPSGTALKMGEVIANALGRDLASCAVYAREGVTGERDPSSIGFATVRGGDIVGEHTVMFAGVGERIEISHKSASRLSYAQGSLRAVQFLAGRQHGLFDMQDVLGLR